MNMRRTERVVWGVVFVAIGGLTVLFSIASFQLDKNNQAFIYACETMGGVPVIGTYGTKACFKSDVLK